MKKILQYCFILVTLTLLLNKANAQSLTPPRFPGGEKELQTFLAENLKWPNSNVDLQGTVFVHFFVEKDGSLSDVKVTKGVSSDFDAEALRVIKKSPKWIPARQNHQIIKSGYTIPIKFFVSAS